MRSRLRRLGTAGLFGAFLLVSAIGAGPEASPIAILRCTINQRMFYVDPFESVTIAFSNRSDRVVDEVHFVMRYNGRTEEIVDRGTFSKNVLSEHTFRAFWNTRYEGAKPAECFAEYAHFVGEPVTRP